MLRGIPTTLAKKPIMIKCDLDYHILFKTKKMYFRANILQLSTTRTLYLITFSSGPSNITQIGEATLSTSTAARIKKPIANQ